MYQAVLFDLDGTLTDTLKDIADAMNRTLTKHGLPVWPVDDYRYMVGNGARMLAKRAVKGHEEQLDAVFDDYMADYFQHKYDSTAPYPGIQDMLKNLEAKGMKLCVLSNKPHQDTLGVIRRYFPDVPFDIVQGQLPDVPLKPDPTAALRIADRLSIPPERFLYLGDTAVDMECARRAGMAGIGVLWGFRKEDELRQAGASFIISRPGELLSLISENPSE